MISDLTLFILVASILIQYILIVIFRSKNYYFYLYRKNRMMLRVFMLTFIIEFTVISLYFIFKNDTSDTVNDTANIEISDRIENLFNTLSDASTEILTIQQELEARIDYVENLKQEAEIAENMISLSEAQVNAVQAKLSQQLEASNNISFIQSFIPGAIYFILGSIFTPLISLLISKFRKNTTAENIPSAFDGYSNDEILMAIKLLKTMKNIQNDNASNPLVQEK